MPTGIYVRTKEYRDKMSKVLKDRHWSLSRETKKKMSKAHKGIKLSKEHREALSKVLKGNKKLIESLTGRKHSEETKRKIGKANKIAIKKWWSQYSEEERIKISKNFILSDGAKASRKANPSSIEKMICKVLDNLEVEYIIQYRIKNWLVDIYIPNKNLVIEINGDYWHDYKIFPKQKIRDDNLQRYCDENNYKLLWLWESEIRKNPKLALINGLDKEDYASINKL